MPRSRRWYRIEAARLRELLQRLSLKDGLLLWEALGEDPRAFPLGNPEGVRKAKQRIRWDKVSQGNGGKEGTKCPIPLCVGEEKPHTKKRKQRDTVSQGIEGNGGTKPPRYSDPAGRLAEELGGWRAGLLFRARKEQNHTIQRLAHGHREALLEWLNLVEALPLPKRVPTALAWLGELEKQLERLGDEAMREVLLEVRKKAPENPLSYAARVLAARSGKEEKQWTPTGERF